MNLSMLKGDADSVSSITSDLQKNRRMDTVKASYFIEIKKIN